MSLEMIEAWMLRRPERLDIVALNMAASMIAHEAAREERERGQGVGGLVGVGEARPDRAEVRVEHPHGEGRDEPDEGPEKEEREAQERDLPRGRARPRR